MDRKMIASSNVRYQRTSHSAKDGPKRVVRQGVMDIEGGWEEGRKGGRMGRKEGRK